MYACLNGHRESLRILLDHGADITLRDDDGETALHKVASHGSVHQLEIIVSALSSDTFARLLSTPNADGRTPLQLAFLRGHKEFVRYLLRHNRALLGEVVALLLVAARDRMQWPAAQWQNFRVVLQSLVEPTLARPRSTDDDDDDDAAADEDARAVLSGGTEDTRKQVSYGASI